MRTRHNLAPTVLIRAARGSDGPALDDLARLDSQRPLAGDVLVAERDGALVAAIAEDRVVADPFTLTGDVVALLRLHADRSRSLAPRRSRVRVPHLRTA